MPRRKYETNQDLINRLMKFSKTGALMEMFIIDALEKQSRAVCDFFEENPERLNDNWFINPQAWKACAEEILKAFEERNARNFPEKEKETPKADPRQDCLDFDQEKEEKASVDENQEQGYMTESDNQPDDENLDTEALRKAARKKR